jgi:hypothetical protein
MQTMDEWEQEESVAVQPLFSSLLKYITNTEKPSGPLLGLIVMSH